MCLHQILRFCVGEISVSIQLLLKFKFLNNLCGTCQYSKSKQQQNAHTASLTSQASYKN